VAVNVPRVGCDHNGSASAPTVIQEVRFARGSPREEERFEPSVPRERVYAFRDHVHSCNRSGARYRNKWYIDDSDGALLFGLGIHGQYLFVDAEKLVVAKVSSQELPLDAARITATLRAVSAIWFALAG
jgi:hypothetical protein